MKKVTKLDQKTKWKLAGQTITIDKIETSSFDLTGNISRAELKVLPKIVLNVAQLSNAEFYKERGNVVAQIADVNKNTLIRSRWKMTSREFDAIVYQIQREKPHLREHLFYIR